MRKDRISIGRQDAGRWPDQIVERLAITLGTNQKDGQCRGHRHPQPRLFGALFPARFINIGILVLSRLQRLGMNRLQRLAGLRFEITDAAQ